LRGGILPNKAAIFNSPALHLAVEYTIALCRDNGDAEVEAGKKFVFFFIDSDGEGAKEGKIAARLDNHRFIDEAFWAR
jgi:hypothetical protein